jgi:prefoldin subunit 5
MMALGTPAQTDREKEALQMIGTLLKSVEQAHAMIGQLTRTLVTMNARLERLEGASEKPGRRIILPTSQEVGHG